jgi:hypothetical protein
MSVLARGRLRGFSPSVASVTSWAACLTWLVALPVGVWAVRRINLNPLSTQGVTAPVAYLMIAGVLLVGLALWLHAEWLTGIAAGLFAAWCGVTVAANLVGTPYGYGAMGGDAGRMSALVTHFSTTWLPTDAADPALPPEYPPLYPMLIGRAAAATGQEAWRMLGSAQGLFLSLGILAAFLLWRRMVPAGVALALSGTVLIGLYEPSKAYEVLALAVFLPLVLATFAPPKEVPPLNPILGGVAFGLMVPMFPNFLILGILGIALVLLFGWRAADAPRTYLVHAAITVGIAVVLSSWYLGPLIYAYSQGKTQVVADLFKSGILATGQLPLFDSDSNLIFALQVVGVAGIVGLWRRVWWAQPMGLLLGGVLIMKSVMLLRFVFTGHSFMLLYVPYLLRFAVGAAGVLTLWELWRQRAVPLLVRLGAPRRLSEVLAVAAVTSVIAQSSWSGWLALPAGSADANGAGTSSLSSMATHAHREYLPDGTKPRYAFRFMATPLPANEIYRLIDTDLGKQADPVILAADHRVFSFRDFRNYLPPARESANALTRWDDRKKIINRLASLKSADQMAPALANTAFGPIDVVLLQVVENKWTLRKVEFSKSAFAGPQFTVHDGLPGGFVLITRKAWLVAG